MSDWTVIPSSVIACSVCVVLVTAGSGVDSVATCSVVCKRLLVGVTEMGFQEFAQTKCTEHEVMLLHFNDYSKPFEDSLTSFSDATVVAPSESIVGNITLCGLVISAVTCTAVTIMAVVVAVMLI